MRTSTRASGQDRVKGDGCLSLLVLRTVDIIFYILMAYVVLLPSHVRLFVTPWTSACQVLLVYRSAQRTWEWIHVYLLLVVCYFFCIVELVFLISKNMRMPTHYLILYLFRSHWGSSQRLTTNLCHYDIVPEASPLLCTSSYSLSLR